MRLIGRGGRGAGQCMTSVEVRLEQRVLNWVQLGKVAGVLWRVRETLNLRKMMWISWEAELLSAFNTNFFLQWFYISSVTNIRKDFLILWPLLNKKVSVPVMYVGRHKNNENFFLEGKGALVPPAPAWWVYVTVRRISWPRGVLEERSIRSLWCFSWASVIVFVDFSIADLKEESVCIEFFLFLLE